MLRKKLRIITCLSLLILFSIFSLLMSCLPQVWAQGNNKELQDYERAKKDPGLKEMQEDIAKLQSRVQKLQQKIAKIRNKALDENPELEDILRELVLTRNEIMNENLAQEGVKQEKLQEIEDKLQDPGISSEKKADLEQKKKEIFSDYKQAEMRTARNKQVQELRKEFYTKLLEASKEENDDIEQMLQELQRLQHQLRFTKQEALPQEEE